MACTSPKIVVGGVTMSTSDFENARELLDLVSGDGGDPTLDEYEENIANGNNTSGKTGVQFPSSKQTTLPSEITQEAQATVDKKPPGLNGNDVVCIPWAGNYSLQLSANFSVKDFTVGALWPHQMIDYPGYSINTRVCNLQGLATNVAEPLRSKFGKFRINSGLRNETSASNGVSQHIKGEAMDIQFEGWNYERYWNNAQWIVENIPFDQFIYEHSDKTGLVWYHLSFRRGGNRPAGDRTKVMTMYKNQYSPGLKRYG
jgi:hypothetical protein